MTQDKMKTCPQVIWIWQNGDHWVAYDNLYPTRNNDPAVLGEPVGRFIATPPTDGLRGDNLQENIASWAKQINHNEYTVKEVSVLLTTMASIIERDVIASQAEKLRVMREENDNLQTAFGYFLNGMGYYTTFPDNAEDGEQLRKSATWNFLTAQNLVQDHVKANCDQAMKSHAMGQPEHKAMVEKCWHKLKENK